MKKRKLTGFELVWYLGVFGLLLVWFTQIHPLVVYDADDWTYLAYVRSAHRFGVTGIRQRCFRKRLCRFFLRLPSIR